MSPKIHHAAAAARGDVGGEDLHRGMAGLDRLAELAGDVGRQVALEHDVERVIGVASIAPPGLVALLDGAADGVAVGPADEVDHRRRAAEQRGATDLRRALGEARRAVRVGQVPEEVHVRVDPARYDDFAGRVDQPRSLRHGEGPVHGDGGDPPAGDRHVGGARTVRGDDAVAADDEFDHDASSPCQTAPWFRRRRTGASPPNVSHPDEPEPPPGNPNPCPNGFTARSRPSPGTAPARAATAGRSSDRRAGACPRTSTRMAPGAQYRVGCAIRVRLLARSGTTLPRRRRPRWLGRRAHRPVRDARR
jgi:hypothetical protein